MLSAIFAAVTWSAPIFAAVTAESASAAVAMSPAPNKILAPGIASSLISVTPFAIRFETVIFLVSLAESSTMASSSAATKSLPDRAERSLILRSAIGD